MTVAIKFTLSETYDKNKKDLIFCSANKKINDDNLFLTRYLFNIADILSDNFNVFILISATTLSKLKNISSIYPKFNYIHLKTDALVMTTKKKNSNYININKELVEKVFKDDLRELNVKGIFIEPPVLPAQKYFNESNEFFDKLQIDSNDIFNKIKIVNEKIDSKKLFSYTAFSMKYQAILLDMCLYFNKNFDTSIYQFVIDPGAYTPYLIEKCNAITYYFENDFRGTRQLHQFPMAQLNYLYNYSINKNCKNFEDKTNNFIWGGAVLLPKGNRINDYYTFIHDFNFDKSVLHISNTNSISKGKQLPKSISQNGDYMKVLDDITNQKLNEGLLSNAEFENKLNDYKYTLILKCASINDSLNFRIIYSLLFNMIPFIDINYDIDNLQIPKEFKDKLSIKDSDELINKLNYFENHQSETINLLNDMQNYFLNKKYYSKDWYLQQFKNNYFKNIF